MDQLTEKTDAQFVTLGIDRELFAVPVEAVLEILDMREMFRVPDAPPRLAGLIDVRGRSVPVIDLRVKLGLAPVAATHGTRIMVREVLASDEHAFLGASNGQAEPASSAAA
jgi:purine-binding chemotaxis protein CheW